MCVLAATALVAVLCFEACGGSSKARQPSDAAACELDLKTLETAEEAYYAENNTYGTYPQLIAAGFASDPGSDMLHTLRLSSDAASYTLTGSGKHSCNVNYP